jgi:hypothetical protein
MVLLTIQMSQY